MNKSKVNDLKLSGLAASSVILPSLMTQNFPSLFTRIAPYTQNTLPYCTGVCGSCGASCVGSAGIILVLALAALRKRKKQ